jgi:hypothetical protein
MIGGWWYLIDWHQWPAMMHANQGVDWTKYWSWLDAPIFHFGSKVTRPGYYLTTGAFLIAFRDHPSMWFGATVALFSIGVFAITAFVSRLAGPIFGVVFAGFLLLHPMWSEIMLILTSELFAFVGLSVAALLAQRVCARYSTSWAVLAVCFGAYGISSKENIALSAVVCLPIIAVALLVWSRAAAIRISWILVSWWLVSLIMLVGIVHGALIDRIGGKAFDLYGREISLSAIYQSFLRWQIFWLPLLAVFLIAVLAFALVALLNRADRFDARNVLNRHSQFAFAALISAAGAACALVNVACYREFIQGRYLFPLALLPWLVCAGLISAFYPLVPVFRHGFGLISALGASLLAVAVGWPKDAPVQQNFESVDRFLHHSSLIRTTLEDAQHHCQGKAHPKIVLLSHDFNDLEPVLATDILLRYLNIPDRRYLLREGYSLESAKDDFQIYLWKTMQAAVEKGVLLSATKDDLNEADFVIQFSAPENSEASFPNLWPLYLHQD